MKVKICGITNIDDALLSESCGADALGFIFYKESKRYINPKAAKEIINRLSSFTMKVGVFVNEIPAIINQIASDIKLNTVQLHGDETPGYVNKINYPVIKAVRINNSFDFSTIEKYNNASILLDTFSFSDFGGTGNKFNWDLIPASLRTQIILAGGISVDDLNDIMNRIKPAAIDVSSSLEKEAGKKDELKVKQFFQKINSYRSTNGNHDEVKRPAGRR